MKSSGLLLLLAISGATAWLRSVSVCAYRTSYLLQTIVWPLQLRTAEASFERTDGRMPGGRER